jgi:hypothetical protein
MREEHQDQHVVSEVLLLEPPLACNNTIDSDEIESQWAWVRVRFAETFGQRNVFVTLFARGIYILPCRKQISPGRFPYPYKESVGSTPSPIYSFIYSLQENTDARLMGWDYTHFAEQNCAEKENLRY